MDRWRDRIAVVTGASSGIGQSAVRHLAAAGMKVAALARRADRLQELEKELNTEWKVKGLICDITKEGDVKATFRWIIDNWGPISVLVNNAGVYRSVLLTEEWDNEAVRTIFETNVLALTACTKEALSCMKTHNISDGHIININSVAGHRLGPHKGIAAYSASKHAVTVLTTALKNEIKEAKMKIRASSISPGLVNTEMSEQVLKRMPDMPSLTSDDISKALLYVLSAPPHVNVSEVTIEPI